MLPDWSTLAIFAFAAWVLLVIPGPSVLYIVARSVDQGRAAGIVSALGVQVGSLLHVAAAARGRGVGRALLVALIEASEAAGVWTLQASIFSENEASVALHLSHGFRVVGRRRAETQISWRLCCSCRAQRS